MEELNKEKEQMGSKDIKLVEDVVVVCSWEIE